MRTGDQMRSDGDGSQGTITQLVVKVKGGNQQAAFAIWQRYFDRLVAIARRKLAGCPRAAADEEDVVLSAFGSLLRGAESNKFQRLNDRDDLWQVLVMLTVRKAINHRNRELAQKRGSGRVLGESALFGSASNCDGDLEAGIVRVVDARPSPAFMAELEDEMQQLFGLLDEEQQRIVLWRLEGHTNRQIAERLERTESWVERKFRRVRRQWTQAGG